MIVSCSNSPFVSLVYVHLFILIYVELSVIKVCSLIAYAALPPGSPAEVRKLRIFTAALVS